MSGDTTVESRAPAVELAVKTDPGRDPDKQVNEDSNTYLETKLGLLAVVCDGMGGHAGGKEASELAIKSIVGFWLLYFALTTVRSVVVQYPDFWAMMGWDFMGKV